MNNLELQSGTDRRERHRVFARSLFPMDREVSYRAGKTSNFGKGVLHSISQSGLFVRSARMPELGSDVAMDFFFETQKVRCEGKVIYCNPSDDGLNAQGFGVKFTRMMATDYALIKNAIDSFHQMMRP